MNLTHLLRYETARTSFLFLLSAFLFIPHAHAAIAFDAVTGGNDGVSESSYTLAHTATGDNGVVVVEATSQPGVNITGVTWNGNAMTQVGSNQDLSGTGVVSLWYYFAGTFDGSSHNVVMTTSGNSYSRMRIASYTGVNQSGLDSLNQIAMSSTNPYTMSTTVVNSNSWMIAGARNTSTSFTNGTGTTIRSYVPDDATVIADSNGTVGTGSQSLNLVQTSGNAIGSIISIYPATPSTPSITGSGSMHRLARFTATTTIEDSLFSDDGSNVTLTSGNLFMQVGSVLDSITNGILNFGTTNATTMTFGRSGQNMIINSKVGIGTSTPSAMVHVNGDIFGNALNLLANGLGLDTFTAGILSIGSTTATSIKIGSGSATTTVIGPLSVGTVTATAIKTSSVCNSSASPATCSSASSGSVAMATGGSTLVVNTTAISANSQILITEDSSLGSRLGITCNTTTGRVYSVSSRTAGTSFTIKSSANPATNKACLSYWIIN